MTTLEKIILGLLAGAEADAPVFVGSTKGMLILNASEILLAGILAAFAPKAPAAPPVVTA
jgi:hypothetical protein